MIDHDVREGCKPILTLIREECGRILSNIQQYILLMGRLTKSAIYIVCLVNRTNRVRDVEVDDVV